VPTKFSKISLHALHSCLTFWCSADAVDHMHIVGQLSQRWLYRFSEKVLKFSLSMFSTAKGTDFVEAMFRMLHIIVWWMETGKLGSRMEIWNG